MKRTPPDGNAQETLVPVIYDYLLEARQENRFDCFMHAHPRVAEHCPAYGQVARRLLIRTAYNERKAERRGAAMTLKEIETEVLKLNPAGRARLAGKLLNSLEALTEAEVERLWVEETERRNEQMEQGVVEARPAEDVIRDARARLG